MSITILNPGMLTSVQDLGRIGYQQYGVSVSGVMDPRSASIANILVDNDEGEEMCIRDRACLPQQERQTAFSFRGEDVAVW